MAKAECGPRSVSSQSHAVDTMLNRPNAVYAVWLPLTPCTRASGPVTTSSALEGSHSFLPLGIVMSATRKVTRLWRLIKLSHQALLIAKFSQKLSQKSRWRWWNTRRLGTCSYFQNTRRTVEADEIRSSPWNHIRLLPIGIWALWKKRWFHSLLSPRSLEPCLPQSRCSRKTTIEWVNGLIVNPDNSSEGMMRRILNNPKSLFKVFQIWHKKLLSVNVSAKNYIHFLGTHLAFFLIYPLSKNHKKLFNMKYTDEGRRKNMGMRLKDTNYYVTISKQQGNIG